jgi:hypothetical protein
MPERRIPSTNGPDQSLVRVAQRRPNGNRLTGLLRLSRPDEASSGPPATD